MSYTPSVHKNVLHFTKVDFGRKQTLAIMCHGKFLIYEFAYNTSIGMGKDKDALD